MKKPTQKVEITLFFFKKRTKLGSCQLPRAVFQAACVYTRDRPSQLWNYWEKAPKSHLFLQLVLSPVFSSLKLVRGGCLGHAVRSSVTVGTTSRATTSPALVIAPVAGGAGAARKVRNTPG